MLICVPSWASVRRLWVIALHKSMFLLVSDIWINTVEWFFKVRDQKWLWLIDSSHFPDNKAWFYACIFLLLYYYFYIIIWQRTGDYGATLWANNMQFCNSITFSSHNNGRRNNKKMSTSKIHPFLRNYSFHQFPSFVEIVVILLTDGQMNPLFTNLNMFIAWLVPSLTANASKFEINIEFAIV